MFKILALSDLHGYLPDIPPCDLLLLAGDYNPKPKLYQEQWMLEVFRPWFNALPAKQIVWVAGNHDHVLQNRPAGLLDGFRGIYLEDSGCTVDGPNGRPLSVYGTPWTPTFYNWAFMKPDDKLKPIFGRIPNRLDILITHGPPKGILDRNQEGELCGSEALWDKVQKARPRLHIFGHIHEGRGRHDGFLGLDKHKTVFTNVSHVNRAYQNWYPPMDFSELFNA